MSVESFSPTVFEHFGGLCTLVDRGDVPPGMSPDCADIEFFVGGIRTRPGTQSIFPVVAGSPYVNGLKSYVTVGLLQRLLEFNSDGTLYKESPVGELTLIASGLATGAFFKSCTLFGREWLAFNDGDEAVDIPRVYDDAFFDRVGMEGPGEGPAAVDGAAGSIAIGAHKIAVWFETRNGGWTRLSPPVTWTAAGSKKVSLTGIAIGPSNVKRRYLAFTAAGGERFYHMPDRMVINDNTTTALTIDFTDSALLSGTNVDHLYRNELIPQVSGVAAYEAAQRLAFWGEVPAMQLWRNLTFEGGFSATRPLGWTLGAGGGGSQETVLTTTAAAYKITGDGTNAVRGLIYQDATVDAWVGLPLIEVNRAYRVRARIRKSAGLVQGNINIDLFGNAGVAIDTLGLVLTPSAVTTTYAEYEAELTPAQAALSTDLTLRVYVDGTPTNGEYYLIDELRIWPSDDEPLSSTVRFTRAAQPELTDSLTHLITVAPDNGEIIRNCFELRDYWYFVKDRSLFATQTNGQDPATWSIQPISNTVGSPSMRGVGLGDGWAVIADRDGLYKFIGGALSDEDKVSIEIQGTWNRINFAGAGNRVWVEVDKKKHRIYVGAPLDEATECSHVLVLDYTEGWQNGMSNEGQGRKWTIWKIAAACGAITESVDGPRLLLGTNNSLAAGDLKLGKIFELKDGARNDDNNDDNANKLNGYYQTHFVSQGRAGQTGGVTLIGMLTCYAVGSGGVDEDDEDVILDGTLNWSAVLPSGATTFLGSMILKPAADTPDDSELMINVEANRVALRFETDALDNWMEVSKVVAWAKAAPWRLA